MTGTEKQIAWAEDIKQRALEAVVNDQNDLIRQGKAKLSTNPEQQPLFERMVDAMNSWMIWLRSQEDAKWWIDHRGLTGREWQRLAQKEMR